jgi:hypothetical protein
MRREVREPGSGNDLRLEVGDTGAPRSSLAIECLWPALSDPLLRKVPEMGQEASARALMQRPPATAAYQLRRLQPVKVRRQSSILAFVAEKAANQAFNCADGLIVVARSSKHSAQGADKAAQHALNALRGVCRVALKKRHHVREEGLDGGRIDTRF